MLNIPVHTEITGSQVVAITSGPCPYCGTHEEPEDRDGVLSCPNCGYPYTPELLMVEEWEVLLAEQADQLDEAGWEHLLAQAEDAQQCSAVREGEAEPVC